MQSWWKLKHFVLCGPVSLTNANRNQANGSYLIIFSSIMNAKLATVASNRKKN